MNIKEQENQLVMDISFKIVLSVLVWVGLVGYVAYRLLIPVKAPSLLNTTISGIPTIKLENINILRNSFKTKSTTNYNIPGARPEPFD